MVVIYEMYQFYNSPFKRHTGTDSSCHTPQTTSSHSLRLNSVEDLDYIPEEELTHKDLKKAVLKRDGVYLFCWCRIQREGQKSIPFQCDASLFQRTGLNQKHQVQNRLLLCSICHGQFHKLKRYVDVVDNKLMVKVVNESADRNSEKYREWEVAVGVLKVTRFCKADGLIIGKQQTVNWNYIFAKIQICFQTERR